MIPYTILMNYCSTIVAVKSTSGLADVDVLPHGVVSPAGLIQAKFRKRQVCHLDQCQKLKTLDARALMQKDFSM